VPRGLAQPHRHPGTASLKSPPSPVQDAVRRSRTAP
jgi:hypothetical protein